MFQNKTQIVKNKLYFNDFKQRRMELYCSKKLPALLRGITPKRPGDFCCLNCLHSFAKNVNVIKMYVKIKIFVML